MRARSGHLKISPSTQQRIEGRGAYFLGIIARELSSVLLKVEEVENGDK